MKELVVHSGPRVVSSDVAIPTPAKGQVVIKVHVVAANPKDWKLPEMIQGRAMNEGEDMAETVHAVGEGIVEFKVGDRVAALHANSSPYGAYAEYAVAWAYTTFHISESVSFEEASTVPLAAISASWALYRNLSLPAPWSPAPLASPTPIIVNGGSTALGAFAIKLAVLSNIHPIIAVAGSGKEYVETLLDTKKGDLCVDYRSGPEETIKATRKALNDLKVYNAIEAVREASGVAMSRQLIAPGGTISMALPVASNDDPAEKVQTKLLSSVSVHEAFGPSPPGGKAFGFIMCQYFGYALGNKTLTGHPYEVIPGGLDGVQVALEDLKAGKVSATKFVFRLNETAALIQ